jgi:glycogen debranching enzyme
MLNNPSEPYRALSEKVYRSFNEKFWFEKGKCLFDVIDSLKGNEEAMRPNQIFSIALRFPVLAEEHWPAVIDAVERELFTPVGLRTLNCSNKEYHGRYEGDRWNRDAAYHQGLVWTWLTGPFLDARSKVYKDNKRTIEFLKAIESHLNEAGIGTVSEIFDGDSPHYPRGCIAQAWSVAETLRMLKSSQL